VFDGVKAGFHHPLGGADGERCELKFDSELGGLDILEGQDSLVQPVLAVDAIPGWSSEETDRARFFAHWRLWRKWSQEMDWRFGFLPADTRLPDHTIWHHMQVTSALAGCSSSDNPGIPLDAAFLKMQVGPVQDFILAARSTRDLWSGSYLLSWLMAAGLKHLSEQVGPDAVIFPSLWGQPLFDLQWKDALWTQVAVSNDRKVKKCWDAIKPTDEAALTPNLPNVFLALVPKAVAADLAKSTAKAIKQEFRKIAKSVWTACDKANLLDDEGALTYEDRKTRFDSQIEQFLNISWTVTEWPADLEKCVALADGFDGNMPISQAKDRVEIVRKMAEELLPMDHRDSRYYHNKGKDHGYEIIAPAKLKSRGLAWPVLLARNSWELDGVRQLREFSGTSGAWKVGTAQNKDVLTGKDEAVAGGRVWLDRVGAADASKMPWKALFRKEDWMGAVTLVKRVWHLSYLRDHWGLPTDHHLFPMPNVHGIAAHEPFSSDESEEPSAGEKYFAVLAFDGDQIGKWVGGEKTPPIKSQLADYSDATGVQRKGMREFFERDSNPDGGNGTLAERMKPFLESRRAVSPSYHLQFSEALGNFALHCAASIVEAYDGRLIYSGGDDVLAMLPADTALECAQDLVRAFQGEAPKKSAKPRLRGDKPEALDWLAQKAPGFLQSGSLRESTGKVDPASEKHIPFVVPGPAATASVGIAIAHFKSPLQDVVRAAQSAEKRAKNQLGRSAVAVSLFKRSGEITEWGCQWQSGGLALYEAVAVRLDAKELSVKFPHRVCQLLEPYLTTRTGLSKEKSEEQDATEFDAVAVISRDFAFAVERQSGDGKKQENLAILLPALESYLAGIRNARSKREKPSSGTESQELVSSLIGLCTTVAFAHRTRSETASPKGTPA